MRIGFLLPASVMLLLPAALLAQKPASTCTSQSDGTMHAAMKGMHGHVDMGGCGPQDSAFAAMQARGKQVMGVDQFTSTHHFDSLPDGGRIVLQRNVADSAGTRTIREHLRHIAGAFGQGDFSLPMQVHAREVPGTRVMADKRGAITYVFRALPRGGEVRIESRDPEAIRAIHEFLAYQRQDHHAAGQVEPHR